MQVPKTYSTRSKEVIQQVKIRSKNISAGFYYCFYFYQEDIYKKLNKKACFCRDTHLIIFIESKSMKYKKK